MYKRQIKSYAIDKRTDWVLNWPAMVILAISGVYWAKEVEEGVDAGDMKAVLDKNTSDLMGLTDLVRGQLTPMERTTLGALITVDVHARDVVAELVDCGLADVADFEWVKQLRYYWRDDLFVDMVQVQSALSLDVLACRPLSVRLSTSTDLGRGQQAHVLLFLTPCKSIRRCRHPSRMATSTWATRHAW